MNRTTNQLLPRALILCGDGINCERETAAAFEAAGFVTITSHVNRLSSDRRYLEGFQALALPGGFSFGDELGSGQILALKLRDYAGDALRQFIEKRKPVIGICNGFQALIKLGLLPFSGEPRSLALTHNTSGHFFNRWAEVEFPESVCIWTMGMRATQFPVRHGEGRLVADESKGSEFAASVLKHLRENRQIPIRYATDINGSMDRIAGLCDPSGVVLGLMPHPEAAMADWLHPSRSPGSARGLEIFKNARRFVHEC